MGGLRYRESIDAFFSGEATGTPPVSCWRHHPVADQAVATMAEATVGFQRRFDCDAVKLMPPSSYQLRDYGMSDRWDGNPIGRRTLGPPIAVDVSSWQRIAAVRAFPHRDQQIEAAALIRRALPSHVPVWATVFSPGFQARNLAGAAFTEHRSRHRAVVDAALEALTVATVDLIDRYFDAGVDGVFYVVQHATAEESTVGEYRSVDLPFDVRCIERIRAGGPAFLHLHGSRVHAELIGLWNPDAVHYEAGTADFGSGGCAVPQATGPGSLVSPLGADPARVGPRIDGLRAAMAGRALMIAPGCALPLATSDRMIDTFLAAARHAS
ncbi:uroporphyrinogen decarboxylase family protein [Mycolicibacterium sp.]|uniref:uroporphyrinogen decarboxylase family protein n=1 Tax=Mycolicibacterium sp. TaxID=2320850 RepID=UPI003D12C5CE